MCFCVMLSKKNFLMLDVTKVSWRILQKNNKMFLMVLCHLDVQYEFISTHSPKNHGKCGSPPRRHWLSFFTLWLCFGRYPFTPRL